MIDHPQLPVLLRQVGAGNHESLGELYDLTAPWVFAALRARVSDSTVATTLAEEFFLQIWRRANQFEQRGPTGQTVVAWMDDIATDLVTRAQPPELIAV